MLLFLVSDKRQLNVINSAVSTESPLHKLRNGTRVLILARMVALAGEKSAGSPRDFNLEAITIRFH